MKGLDHNPGQPHKKEFFDHSENSQEEAVRERNLDLLTAGILANSQALGESAPFEITPGGALTIDVGTGSAVGPHDVDRPESIDASDRTKTGGDRVFVPAADIGVSYQRDPGAGPGTGTGTGPFHETADGIGGFVSTPESTKTAAISLTNGSVNTIFIGFLSAIDDSSFGLHKVTVGLKRYPVREDGYDIVVTTTGVAPGGDPKYIKIGAVDLTLSPGSVTSGDISQTGLDFARTRQGRIAVRIDSALAPTSLADPSTITLEEFVNAVGSGTRTTNNILGLTLADLGFTQDIDLLNHRRQHHTNGLIVPDETSTTTALFSSTSTSTPVGGDSGAVFLRQLDVGNESLLMNGTVFTEVLPKLIAPIGGFAVGDIFVSFNTADAAGVYGIVVKAVGSDATAEKRIFPFSFDSTAEYLVGTVEWSGTAFISPAPPNVQTDDRKFGSISNKDIHVSAVETDNINDDAVTTPKILDSNVTTSKIADLNVTEPKLGPLAVTESKLGTAAVTPSKIQADAVTTTAILDGDVRTINMQDDAITSQKLDEWDSVIGQDTNDGSGVKTGHLADEAVTTAKLSAAVQASISSASVPSGSIIPFAGVEAKVPTGWIPCDGRLLDSISDTSLADLFTTIGTTWGGTGASSFRSPDLRGAFLRGVNTTSEGAAADSFADPDEGSRALRHTGGATSGVASYQEDAVADHFHSSTTTFNVNSHDLGSFSAAPGGSTSTVTGGVQGADISTENRSVNAYVMYMIKT